MIRLSDNARNENTIHESTLLRNPTFSHDLRDQTFGVNRFVVNCFEDSQYTFFSILKMLCKKRIGKNLNFSLTLAMGILLRGSIPSTLSYHGYLKIHNLLKLFGSFYKGGGEVLKVKLYHVKACNDDCHSELRIYFIIIYYILLKANNRAIFFAM